MSSQREEIADVDRQPGEVTIEGYEVIEKEAGPASKTAHVYLPKEWLGETVKAVRVTHGEGYGEEGEIDCPSCDRSDFKTEGGMKRHHAIVHGESLVEVTKECDECGEEFTCPEWYDEQRFCSRECASKAGNKKKSANNEDA